MTAMDELISLLEKNGSLYELLVKNSHEERKALENGAIEKLKEITAEKENITFRLKMLDEKRRALLAEIAEDLGLSDSIVTLRELADRPKYRGFRERVMKVREKLSRVVKRTKELNDFNAKMIINGINIMRHSLQYANAREEKAVTYSNRKEMKSAGVSGAILKRAL